MSDPSGGPPPGWPSPPEPPRGPAKTVIGEPLLVDGAPVFPGLEDGLGSAPQGPAPEVPSGPLATLVDLPALEGPPTNAGAPPYSDVVSDAGPGAHAPVAPDGSAPHLGLTPPLPESGSRRVAATLVDDGSFGPPPAPAQVPAPQPFGGSPNPYVAAPPGPMAMAPPRPANARKSGPPLVAIGVAAALLLGGGLTLAFWLKSRGTSSAEAADAQPLLPTPAVATVASDPPPPGAGEPATEPAAPTVPPPVPAKPPAAKPTTTTNTKPAPSASGSGKGTTPAPTSTGTTPAPKPSGSGKPRPNLLGKGKPPILLR